MWKRKFSSKRWNCVIDCVISNFLENCQLFFLLIFHFRRIIVRILNSHSFFFKVRKNQSCPDGAKGGGKAWEGSCLSKYHLEIPLLPPHLSRLMSTKVTSTWMLRFSCGFNSFNVFMMPLGWKEKRDALPDHSSPTSGGGGFWEGSREW